MMAHPVHVQAAKQRSFGIANIAAVLLIAVVAAIQLASGIAAVLNPSSIGDFGMNLDDASWRVLQVRPAAPADRASIRVDDYIDLGVLPLRDRYIFVGPAVARPGELATIVIERNGGRRTVTLRADPSPRPSVSAATFQVFQAIGYFVFLGVGAALALLRPSMMTWGFYFAAAACAWIGPGSPPYIPTRWFLAYAIYWDDFMGSAAVAGFLVFCLRFPSNELIGWRKTAERFVLYSLVVLFLTNTAQDLARFFASTPPAAVGWFTHIWDSILVALSALSLASLIGTYRRSRGLQRHRIKWVVFGLACATVTVVTAALDFDGRLSGFSPWIVSGLEGLIVVLPLTVAYAVVRHRVIDVRFVLSRALIAGIIAAAIGLMFITLDWLFTAKLPSSRSQAAAYFGIALLAGFFLNASRQRIGKLIDSLLFGQWYRTQENAHLMSHSIRRAQHTAELYEPLTTGVARAFSIASAALFERAEDGGLVRAAAHGWPAGTLWHILPNDALMRRVEGRLRPLHVDSFAWRETEVPSGVARPSVMIPIISSRQICAILLLGAHDDGSGLDPDEIRTVGRLCADAGPLFSKPIALEPIRPSLVSEPLGA